MRLKSTLILVVVAAILVGYYFIVEQPRQRRSEERAFDRADLAAFESFETAAVRIARPDVNLEFTRSTNGWRMTSPFSDLAADGAVNRLLGVLVDGEIVRDIGPQEDLSPFGLEEPAAIITVVTAGGDTVVALEVGNLTVDKYSAYARSLLRENPENVILVPTGVRRYALAETPEFRSQRLVDFTSESVESLTLLSTGRTTTWRRSAEDGWSTYEGDREIRGRKEYIENTLRRLRSLRAREFVPAEEVPLVQPFDAPPRSATVVLRDGSEQTVTAGRRLESRVYVRSRLRDDVDERVVLTDTTILNILGSSLTDLRDRRLLQFDRGQISKIVLESIDFQSTLVRPGGEWAFPNPSLGRIDQQEVGILISVIAMLEYQIVVDEDPSGAELYGLSNPDLSLTIFDETGSPLDRLVCKRSESDPARYVATSRHAGVLAGLAKRDLDVVIGRFQNLRQP
jgi:hypothetical protein